MVTQKDEPLFQEDTLNPSGKMESDNLFAEDADLPASSMDNLFADESPSITLEDDNLFADSELPVETPDPTTFSQTDSVDELFPSIQSQTVLESNQDTWRILVVDDEEDVHQITHLVLDNYVYNGKPVVLFSAYSAEQAKRLLQQQPDFAVLFLDVVMETHDAGLQLVRYVRETLKNHFTRIILRTGQPGYAPEEEVILKYEINDYANKTELSRPKLLTLTTASLRAYSDLILIESYRQNLEAKVVERTQELQQKNEELGRLNKTLIKLNQDKNEFLGIAAHDLKNPLSSIQGLAELIQTAFEEDESAEKAIQEVVGFARMIAISSHQMYELIINLLDVNALESNQMKLLLQQLELRNVVQTVIEHYRSRAQLKDITIHLQAQEIAYPVFVDEFAIRQVLDNIISNAIKYSPFGKPVIVRLTQDKHRSQVEIQDEGPGLSEVDQQQLFGRFCRLTPKPTGDEHSTGLGLFIVKKLVETMNGKVWCESQLGQGTTFTVAFPKNSLDEL